jgi:uncharacterized protein
VNAHVSSILLGVRDKDRSKQFYTDLGWTIERDYGISVFFESHGGSLVGLYGREAEEVFLAADADCSRPPGLTEQAAHAQWLRRWETLSPAPMRR